MSQASTASLSSTWGLYWRMVRPGFLSITVVACLLGMASAAACGCGFDMPKALATLVLALMAHSGANVLNDYHDARNGADAANTHGIFPFTGGSRLIQAGVVSEQDTRQWAWTLLLLSMLGGLLLAIRTDGGLLLIGAAGLALGWAYSAPPLQLMSRGLGEVTVATCWWLVVVGADYVQRQQWQIIPAYEAISYALLVGNILLLNGLPDAQSDRQVGKRTLATRLSARQLAHVYTGVVLLAHGWLALGVWLLIPPGTALWALISLPLGLTASALLYRRAHQPERLTPVIGLTIATALLHGLAMTAGILSLRWV